jgi:hypothetical protein
MKSLTNFENVYKNPPQNSLLCNWSIFSSAILLLAARENEQELSCRGRLPVCFTEPCKLHRRLPVCIFSVKITALVPFSDFKEQAKTLSLIFSSTKKQIIAKTINACTESTYLLL